jgi:hypothetical protein
VQIPETSHKTGPDGKPELLLTGWAEEELPVPGQDSTALPCSKHSPAEISAQTPPPKSQSTKPPCEEPPEDELPFCSKTCSGDSTSEEQENSKPIAATGNAKTKNLFIFLLLSCETPYPNRRNRPISTAETALFRLTKPLYSDRRNRPVSTDETARFRPTKLTIHSKPCQKQ